MKCPTVDKLAQYVDDRQAHEDVAKHVKDCAECQRVVEAFEGEQRFIKETLQTPTLPDDFAHMVIDQLEPYEQRVSREKRAPWKKILLSAAGVVLALGVSATMSPGFANWIGSVFSTNQVDEGLRMATDAGLVERVNLQVTDNGITLKVEDVVNDSSRVALSYQVINKNGIPQDTYLNLADSANKMTIVNQNGTTTPMGGTGWQQDSDYGFVEIPLNNQENLQKITVKFDLVELNGVKGNWKLEVPIDVTKNNDLTTTFSLQKAITSHHGVAVQLKDVQFAPSITEFAYETNYTGQQQEQVAQELHQLKQKLGVDEDHYFNSYRTAIEYHLADENGKTIYERNYGQFFTMDKQPGELTGYSSSGNDGEQLGQVMWNESFIPQKGDRKLTFVLDGVYKTVPSDFSVTFKPRELRQNPKSFEYEGNFITIKKADTQGEYSMRKSLIPIERDTVFMIEMAGGIEVGASDLGNWVLMDDEGNTYSTYESGAILAKKDKNDRHKTTIDLKVYDLEEVPEELTLHLVSVTRYEEVKEKWSVPLY